MCYNSLALTCDANGDDLTWYAERFEHSWNLLITLR